MPARFFHFWLLHLLLPQRSELRMLHTENSLVWLLNAGPLPLCSSGYLQNPTEKRKKGAAHLEQDKVHDLSGYVANLSRAAFLIYLFLCVFALANSASGTPLFFSFGHHPYLLGSCLCCVLRRTRIVLSSSPAPSVHVDREFGNDSCREHST